MSSGRNCMKCTLKIHDTFSYRYILVDEKGNEYAADQYPHTNFALQTKLDERSGQSVNLEIVPDIEPHNPAFYDGLNHVHILDVA